LGKKVHQISKNIVKEQSIDVVHHFNHLSFRQPGYLWKLNKPFVWGPTSGVSLLPFPYLIKLPPVILFTNLLRNLINITQSKLSINLNRAIKKASLIFFVTKEDGRYFEKKTSYIKHLLDTGGYTKNDPLDLINPVNEKNDINILWVGRLDHLKALEILLYAIGSSNYLKSNVSIKIIGDGPQIDLYKKIAQKLKLNNIHWMGLISKKEVLASMKESDFLVHTSIKEAASAVVLEALSEGLPVICHDAFGLSFAVTKSCGIKVGFKSPENSINEFKKAIYILSKDKLLRSKLSLGAKERSNELNWQSMAETISLGYIETFNKTN
jgi:glycosyltransferase involved in cell wall biosynthesis